MNDRNSRVPLSGSLCAMLALGLAWPAVAQQTAVESEAAPSAEAATPAAEEPAADATPAAQAGGAPDDIGEVIVTARRIEEKLQDVPISITVFNQDQLSDLNVTSATDLAAFTPSLTANNNFGGENASFAIRGFVQDAGTAPSVGTYFADVVAPRGPTQGTQAGDGVGPGSFFDLQNVQVLKGPQGTLFGRNTTGGAVLLVPQKPTGNTEGYAEGSIGNYGMRRFQGVFNTPFGEGARFRVAYDHQTRDGYLKNVADVGPSAYNDIDYDAVRASLVLDLSPSVENYTIASYSKSDTNGSVQKLIDCNPAGAAPQSQADFATGLRNFIGVFSCGQLDAQKAAGKNGFYDVAGAVDGAVSRIEQWQAINTTTWNASDNLTVKNIASYAQFKDYQKTPLFGINWDVANLSPAYQPLFFRGIPQIFTGIFPAPGHRTADQSTYTEEVQLQGGSDDNRLTYQTGVYLEWSDPLGKSGNQSPQLVNCADVGTLDCFDSLGSTFTALSGFAQETHVGSVNYTVGETTYRNQGIYAQSTYALTEQLKLTGGIRYTRDKQTNDATRITYQFPVVPPYTDAPTATCTDAASSPGCDAAFEKKSSKPTWLIDLDYFPMTDVLTYAKYARGYRAGGVFSNAPSGLRTFDPEKVDSFEVGMKTSFHEVVRGTFNVAAFYNDFSNQQLQYGFNASVDENGTPSPVSPTTGIVNAGKSRIYGAEVEGSINPFRGLTLQASYTYLNATIRKIDPVVSADPNYVASTAIAPGDPLALSPKNKLSLGGSYTLPLDASIGKVSLGLNYVYTDKQTTNYIYDDATTAIYGRSYAQIDSLNLLNANAGWEQFFGTPVDLSLFATNLTGEKYYQFIPGLGNNGAEFATVGEPRMYGMRLRYRFG
ncbi:TonB-dependent receptor [Hydrocarboniphaga sp.]|uniref:TonB-dependent receptor n=1 Tax=Hydrocarboniphaga sp. TaxID=2033016 RepID=UPI003D13EC90